MIQDYTWQLAYDGPASDSIVNSGKHMVRLMLVKTRRAGAIGFEDVLHKIVTPAIFTDWSCGMVKVIIVLGMGEWRCFGRRVETEGA